MSPLGNRSRDTLHVNYDQTDASRNSGTMLKIGLKVGYDIFHIQNAVGIIRPKLLSHVTRYHNNIFKIQAYCKIHFMAKYAYLPL